jgi:hypothetical protein
MELSKINEKLKDLKRIRSQKDLIEKSKKDNEDYMPEWDEVYPFEGEYFIKLRIQTDSYGENENIISVQIVKEVIKKVSQFEAV